MAMTTPNLPNFPANRRSRRGARCRRCASGCRLKQVRAVGGSRSRLTGTGLLAALWLSMAAIVVCTAQGVPSAQAIVIAVLMLPASAAMGVLIAATATTCLLEPDADIAARRAHARQSLQPGARWTR